EASSHQASDTTVITWRPDDAHQVVTLLARAHANSKHVHYALDHQAIAALEESATRLLTRDTLRRHMASLARAGRAPQHANTERCQQALRGLDPLDPPGLPQPEQRNPNVSATAVR